MINNFTHTQLYGIQTTQNLKIKELNIYIDGKLKEVNYTHTPNIAGRFWIGAWFPTWTGEPEFDTDVLEIDWVRITPFNQSGDRYDIPESFPDFGWAPGTDSFYTIEPPSDDITIPSSDNDTNPPSADDDLVITVPDNL